MKKSRRTHEGGISEERRRHATHIKELCNTYQGIMPHIERSHATHMKEPCHNQVNVMPHVRKQSHLTYGIDLIFCGVLYDLLYTPEIVSEFVHQCPLVRDLFFLVEEKKNIIFPLILIQVQGRNSAHIQK